MRQAVAEGGSDRDVLRRLVEVLATLSLVDAAELRDLTATVFKTSLVPCSEPVAEAKAEAGRFYHEAAGAIKDKARGRTRRGSRPARSTVRARVGGVPAQLGGDEGVGTTARGDRENLLGGQRGEELASALGGARAALPGRIRAGRPRARKGACASCSASIRLLSHSSQYWRLRCCCRKESGSTARPREDPLERSIEALGTDAREVERLARRLEAVSQRMADLLRRGVLEPSLAYAFLMKKGGATSAGG